MVFLECCCSFTVQPNTGLGLDPGCKSLLKCSLPESRMCWITSELYKYFTFHFRRDQASHFTNKYQILAQLVCTEATNNRNAWSSALTYTVCTCFQTFGICILCRTDTFQIFHLYQTKYIPICGQHNTCSYLAYKCATFCKS